MGKVAILLASTFLLVACSSPSVVPSKDAATDDGGTDATSAADASIDLALPPVECEVVDDCEAVLPGAAPLCKQLGCEEGMCVLVDSDDGTECASDGFCILEATCQAGACVAGPTNACDDDNACTTDGCDPASGCVNTYNQKPCDDGTVCTLDDHCSQGSCVGDGVGCDDGNQCTEDVCDPVDGCTSVVLTGGCSDDDACTDVDLCVNGQCVPGGPLECNDDEPCTLDSCGPLVGCVNSIVDGDCEDGNACTSDDSCKAGTCQGELVACDDGELCTSDYCDPVNGCVFQPNALNCEDGDSCTLADQCCHPGLGDCTLGTCISGEQDPLCCDEDPECDDDDPCTNDACAAGYCGFTPLDCNDGLDCTGDTCDGGLCVHTPYGPLENGEIFNEGFEIDAGAWEIDSSNAEVTWQLDSLNKKSGQNALYCGNKANGTYSYDFGQTLASATKTFVLPPSNALSLQFFVLQDLQESGSCTYDVTRILVNGEQVLALCSNLTSFTEQTIDLTTYAGQTVEVEFRFDTKDGVANGGLGVWLDDIRVLAESPEGCCATQEQCTEGTGCNSQACLEDTWTCGVPESATVCDDADDCTLDACVADGQCTHEAIEGCI